MLVSDPLVPLILPQLKSQPPKKSKPSFYSLAYCSKIYMRSINFYSSYNMDISKKHACFKPFFGPQFIQGSSSNPQNKSQSSFGVKEPCNTISKRSITNIQVILVWASGICMFLASFFGPWSPKSSSLYPKINPSLTIVEWSIGEQFH